MSPITYLTWILALGIAEMEAAHGALLRGDEATGIPPLPSAGALRDAYLGED